MFTVEYADGWYIAENGLGIIDFPNGNSESEFAQWVCDALNAAKQRTKKTKQTSAQEIKSNSKDKQYDQFS